MLNYILYRIGQAIALFVPLKIGYKIAQVVADLQYLFAANDRKAIKKNLKVIFPQKSNHQIRKIRRQIFRNFAKYLVDFFRFSKLDKEYLEKNIKIENIQYFDQALKDNKGVIVLTAHLGNWELGGTVIALSGYPFWVVALPHKNKKVNDFFNFQRESKGVHVIPFGKAARHCLSLLKENKMIALVGDRDFSAKGMLVDFFGKPTLFPLGPAVFSLKTHAAIVPGFMFRNPDDTFTLRIEKPINIDALGLPLDDGSQTDSAKEKNLLKIIDSYKIIIEDYIRKYPDQWYMFKRFWIE